MKGYLKFLIIAIGMIAIVSVGHGMAGPSTNASLEISQVTKQLKAVPVISLQMNVIAKEQAVTNYERQKAERNAIIAEAIFERPAKTFVLIKFKSYSNDPNSKIKPVEIRCRSSDIG